MERLAGEDEITRKLTSDMELMLTERVDSLLEDLADDAGLGKIL